MHILDEMTPEVEFATYVSVIHVQTWLTFLYPRK